LECASLKRKVVFLMLVTGSYDFYYLNNYDEYCDILKLMYIRHYLVTFPDNSVV